LARDRRARHTRLQAGARARDRALMSAAASETRRLPRSGVLLVVGLAVASVGASVGAVMALAHGTARPIAPSIGSGIVVIDTNLAFQGAVAAGTGMVLTSSGEVLTNNHVISG